MGGVDGAAVARRRSVGCRRVRRQRQGRNAPLGERGARRGDARRTGTGMAAAASTDSSGSFSRGKWLIGALARCATARPLVDQRQAAPDRCSPSRRTAAARDAGRGPARRTSLPARRRRRCPARGRPGRRRLDPQHEVADVDLVAFADDRRLSDLPAVDVRAVRALEIGDDEAPVAEEQPSVPLRHVALRQHQVVALHAADVDLRPVEGFAALRAPFSLMITENISSPRGARAEVRPDALATPIRASSNETCQRGAFDSCSRRRRAGSSPDCAACALERARRGAGRARDAGPGIDPPSFRPSHASGSTSSNRLSRRRQRWRPPSRCAAPVRRSIDVLAGFGKRLACARRARCTRSAPRPRRAYRGGDQEIAARRAGSLRDMARPSRITRRLRGSKTRLFDKSANLDGCANSASHPACAVTARDRVLPSRIRCTARNSRRRLLQPETAGEAVLPRVSAGRTIIAA